jgi:cyclic 2,3-diphosphoglycerate synthetase
VRVLALADGEHYPPVVRAALDQVPQTVVGVVLLGGSEKLADPNVLPDLGVPVVTGPTPDAALLEGLTRFAPDLVVDLADQPVVDARTRMRLAARALAAGVAYQGADFRFDPPPRPRVATKPSVAVIGTGKRTGKTAVAAQLARTLRQAGTPPVIVTMGRGGPAEPELVDPATFDLTPGGLLALARAGRHAASDHFEDALLAGVATVGTRRCGGGLAGAPGDDTFQAGVRLADARPETLLVFEGSGQAIPPVHADATICVVPATAETELVTGYLGAYRLLLSDLVVVSMAETSLADSGAVASLERAVRGLVSGGPNQLEQLPRFVHTVFRPTPLAPISGRRVFYVTTAPAPALGLLVRHLEHEHGGKVVGCSNHLANRPLLSADLARAEGADVLVVELKAAAIDLAVGLALERGMDVVFCDNQVVTVGGDGTFEELSLHVTELARQRHTEQQNPEQRNTEQRHTERTANH